MEGNLAWLDNRAIEILSRVVIAMIAGGLIGLERELADRPAGLRTHMMVSGACALIVSLSSGLVTEAATHLGERVIETDPVRIIEAVITGISFICAGTIIQRDKRTVDGLTTAASLLLSASIAIAVAIGYYAVAIIITVLCLMILRGIKILERLWFKEPRI